MVKVSKFDAADYLKNPVAIAAYLTEAFETNDPVYICTAFDTVARVKGNSRNLKGNGTLAREPLQNVQRNSAARIRYRSKGHGIVWSQAGCRTNRTAESGLKRLTTSPSSN